MPHLGPENGKRWGVVPHGGAHITHLVGRGAPHYKNLVKDFHKRSLATAIRRNVGEIGQIAGTLCKVLRCCVTAPTRWH